MSNSTETAADPIVQPGLDGLATTRWFTLEVAKDIKPDQLAARPCAKANHAAFILGHIAWTDDFFLTAVAGKESGLPEGWADKFSFGKETSDDAKSYPDKAELLRVLEDRRAAIVAWFSSLSREELLEPIEGEMSKFARNRAAMPSTLAFHEGVHAGQLSTCRRALGYERMF